MPELEHDFTNGRVKLVNHYNVGPNCIAIIYYSGNWKSDDTSKK